MSVADSAAKEAAEGILATHQRVIDATTEAGFHGMAFEQTYGRLPKPEEISVPMAELHRRREMYAQALNELPGLMEPCVTAYESITARGLRVSRA